jgi:hypothetical protein
MDHIDKVLTTSLNNTCQFSLPICVALAVGKNAMNKYYSKTDHSEVYRIAMSKFFLSKLIRVYTNTMQF